VEHGGTFHFVQFNVLHATDFLESKEFSYIMNFLNDFYHDAPSVELTKQNLKLFFALVKHKSEISDLGENITF
jgi:hypothetical protein